MVAKLGELESRTSRSVAVADPAASIKKWDALTWQNASGIGRDVDRMSPPPDFSQKPTISRTGTRNSSHLPVQISQGRYLRALARQMGAIGA